MSDDPRVDHLRQQLRSLGYLDAGVDRFVLGPAVRRRSPAVIALLASMRSGIIAAVLLGPAAAIGLAARLPGLVTDVRDAIVVAIYLGVLFGAAVTLLSFLAALAVPVISRSSPQRGRTFSTVAGVLISIACLGYLTLWWRTANAGFGWDAPVWTAFALIVAVGISFLAGYFVTLTARAVVVVRRAADAQSPRVPGASWKMGFGAGMVAFAGAAILLVLTTSSNANHTPVALSVRPSGARVTVVAVDGFDLNLYRQWRGSVPVAAVLPFPIIEAASWVPPTPERPPSSGTGRVFDEPRPRAVAKPGVAILEPVDSTDPARLWTTVATGRSPEAHGVEQLETRRVAGLRGRLTSAPVSRLLSGATDLLRLTEPAIASNIERRTKTFWEIAAQAGFRTSVTNWWATWPVDTSSGTAISDRAILRLERGGALDAEIAPAALYDALKNKWPELRAEAIQEAADFVRRRAQRELPPLPQELRAILARSAELDGMVVRLAEATARESDLLVMYLPGLDIVQQTLFANEPPRPSDFDRRVAALRQYYDYAGSLIAATIARVQQGGVVMLLAQPGRLQQGEGVLAISGPGIRSTDTAARVLDIAPTVLHTLGIPIAQDLEGKVVEGLFQDQSLHSHPVRFVDTYGPRGRTTVVRSGQPLDTEMIERLRSLGYVR